jgi:hypothetical protein
VKMKKLSKLNLRSAHPLSRESMILLSRLMWYRVLLAAWPFTYYDKMPKCSIAPQHATTVIGWRTVPVVSTILRALERFLWLSQSPSPVGVDQSYYPLPAAARVPTVNPECTTQCHQFICRNVSVDENPCPEQKERKCGAFKTNGMYYRNGDILASMKVAKKS